MILERDTALSYPSFVVVSASAGSGKTYTLTLRYVQLLLSPHVPNNALKNILAITFTNNAATEMRARVLALLKNIALGEREALARVREVVSLSDVELSSRARLVVEEILDNYGDFQVRTIDSFLGQVFRASALEFGFSPEFEVAMSNRELVDYAFELFAREIRPGSAAADRLMAMTKTIISSTGDETGYIWDPYARISRHVKKLQSTLSTYRGEVRVEDHSGVIQAQLQRARGIAVEIRAAVAGHGAIMDRNFQGDLDLLGNDAWPEVLTRTPKKKAINKGSTKAERTAAAACEQEIQGLLKEFDRCLAQLAVAHARDYFRPYASVLAMITETLESVKRTRGRLFIGDINKAIVRSLSEEVIPEIYFTLGDRIVHYLIDEFQDTSPIQWAALSVLAGNSLAEGGTLFAVGDAKQSIFGFRGADWRIMMDLVRETQIFPSARVNVRYLDVNRRSGERIVMYSKDLFACLDDPEVAAAADRSGLLGFEQRALPRMSGRGVVGVTRLKQSAADSPEREKILDIIASARGRGYDYRDVAILTPKNDDVVRISGWLNENGIPFISHSSLDVRVQRVTTEMIALLQFLDSPIDDLAFATFVLGSSFPLACAHVGHPLPHEEIKEFIHRSRAGRAAPLYKAFQADYPGQWRLIFESLFAIVGYAPLYDLVAEAYKTLNLFDGLEKESSALVKFLEVIKVFEESGSNSVKDFLEFTGADDDDGEWSLDPGSDADAVRLMTVHKSKGLEFPVVIVLLSEYRSKLSSPIVYDQGDAIELLHITSQSLARSEHLEEIYRKERLNELTDLLNRLYVVLTRAKDELYVIALTKGDKAKAPCSLLAPCEVPAGSLPEADEGEKRRARPSPGVIAPSLHVGRRHVGPVREGTLGFDETRRGDALHAVLARLQFVEGEIGACVDAALDKTDTPRAERQRIREALTGFLTESGVMELFRPMPGRRVLTEQELVNRSGELFRADRLVIDSEGVTVVDYKTGKEHDEEQYAVQIRNYMHMASEVLGTHAIKGCLAYVDLKSLRVVEFVRAEGSRTI